MAKVTIHLKDVEDGKVNISAEFDPPVQKAEGQTPAQDVAGAMLHAALQTNDDEDNPLPPAQKEFRDNGKEDKDD